MKVNNDYMPETFLQACDFVRVMKAALKAAPGQGKERDAIIAAIDQACRDTGWQQADIRLAVLD